jgi:hypothetical protein
VFALILGSGACAERKWTKSTQQPKVSSQVFAADRMENCWHQIVPSQLCLAMTWKKLPKDRMDEGVIEVKFLRPNLMDQSLMPAELEDFDFEFEPWMVMDPPSQSHGTAPVFLERIDTGSFRVSQIYFIMRGTWQLRFKLVPRPSSQKQATVYTLSFDF